MNVNAGLATGTGTALSLSMAQAGLATGTGTAGAITAGYTAGLATGTGTASDIGIGVLAGLASAYGDAPFGSRISLVPLTYRIMPQIQVLAQFDTDRTTWADISAYVRSGTVDLPSTRTAGPLIEYQAGTASLVLKNGDGRFDPDNLSGPYVDQGYQMVVRRFYQLDALETSPVETSQHHTWVSPFTGTVKIRCIAAGGGGDPGTGSAGGAGGGGGEQAIEPIANVTAGRLYNMYIGGGNPNGADGPDTWFIADSGLTIRAHGGTGGDGVTGGTGGTGSSNSLHLDGGAGGDSTAKGGGGGGGSGGDSLPGNAGTAADSNQGAPGGPAVPGGGTGGTGGNINRPGHYPIGSLGAGGGGSGAGGDYGGDGGDGMVEITWFVENPNSGFNSMVLPMVPIQISMIWAGVTYELFTGYADAWTDTGVNVPEYRETNLTCTDGFKALAAIQLPSVKPTGGNEYTGLRIQDILDAAGWPEEHRWIQTGTEKLQATQYGDSALSLLQLSNMTEGGELFIDKLGSVHFRAAESMLYDDRTRRSQALFGDKPQNGELPYTQAIRLSDDTQLVNDVQVTRQGGILQEVTDWTSAFIYRFQRSWSTTATLQINDTKARNFANWVLNGAHWATKRFDTLTIHPMREPKRLYPEVLTRERGDKITIIARPPDADTVKEDVIVRGLHFVWDASSQNFQVTYDLTDWRIGHEEF